MSKEYLKEFIGFGVAGNFAHHLEQAGEASDFINVKVDDINAPKGMFPFYVPCSDTFLGTYPLSNVNIIDPKTTDGNLQMEPEVALICELKYENNQVIDIIPNYFTAYNDCSIRKENAKKISEKKNWGKYTKGISTELIEIDKFEKGGVMDDYHIASFLKRDGKLFEYGEDSSVLTYNYFYDILKQWMIEKLNNQKDDGPLENLHHTIVTANYPQSMIVSIGATSYTDFGKNTFLKVDDEIFVYIYNSTKYSIEDIKDNAISLENNILVDCSKLQQKII